MSKKITLLKAARVPLNGPIRPSGFTTNVDEDTYQVLHERGVIADETVPEVVSPVPVPEPVPQPVVEAPPESKAPVDISGVKLPPMTASIGVWREVADQVGVKTANMRKAEIIGALKQHLNQ